MALSGMGRRVLAGLAKTQREMATAGVGKAAASPTRIKSR
jgi:hypothetical protein